MEKINSQKRKGVIKNMYLQAEECMMKSTIENIDATLVENVKNEYSIPVGFRKRTYAVV